MKSEKKFVSFIILSLFFLFFSCQKKVVKTEQISTQEIEANKSLLIQDDRNLTNKIKILILPFQNKSEKKNQVSEDMKTIIYNSLYNFLNIVSSFDITDGEKIVSEISNFDIQYFTNEKSLKDYEYDFIIYGDYNYYKKGKRSEISINFKIWERVGRKVESFKYLSSADLDIFDTIDTMIAKVIKITLNREMKLAYLKFENFKINNGKYYLFINDKIVSIVSNNNFNLVLKVLAGSEYSIVLKNTYNDVVVLSKKVVLKPEEIFKINHTAIGGLQLLLNTDSQKFKVFLDGKEITFGEIYSNILAERKLKIKVLNLENNYSYEVERYLGDREFKKIVLPLARIGLIDYGYNYTLDGNSMGAISLSISQEYIREGKPSLVMNFNISSGGWAGITFKVDKKMFDWSNMNTLGLWMYGNNTGKWFFVEIEDKDKELFVYPVCDDWVNWKRVTIPLDKLKFRSYQNVAPKNRKLDYPVNHLHFQVFSFGEAFLYPTIGKFTLILNEIEITKE